MRDVEKAAIAGNKDALLAEKVYVQVLPAACPCPVSPTTAVLHAAAATGLETTLRGSAIARALRSKMPTEKTQGGLSVADVLSQSYHALAMCWRISGRWPEIRQLLLSMPCPLAGSHLRYFPEPGKGGRVARAGWGVLLLQD